jgi:hypothetical protein
LATPSTSLDVDWSSPWLVPYRESGLAAQREVAQGRSVAEALNRLLDRSPIQLAGGPLGFMAPATAALPEAYEAHIARTAQVPTRDNPHDFFNGLVWLAFPRLKRCLNELQARQIALHGVGPRRGAVRDRLTMLDENGALWQAPPLLVEALRRRDWQALFVTHRAAWRDARTTLVGHALLEKLTAPRKAITAHAWVVPEGVDAEAWIAGALVSHHPASRAHLPLPVLGVPGWWPANESEGFYADTAVFRLLRG